MSTMDNAKLADAYRDLEADLRQVRRLAGLVSRLFNELPVTPDPEDSEDVSALVVALRSLTIEVERRWDDDWKAAGGRA